MLANTNTQGALSLAMVEEWIQRTLIQKLDHSNYRMALYKAYFPTYSKAICASQDIPGAVSPDEVTASKFCLLIGYLCIYALAFDAFMVLRSQDNVNQNEWTGSDKKLLFPEWLSGYCNISCHGFVLLAKAIDGTEEALTNSD